MEDNVFPFNDRNALQVQMILSVKTLTDLDENRIVTTTWVFRSKPSRMEGFLFKFYHSKARVVLTVP
jgi:hypothetical protein